MTQLGATGIDEDEDIPRRNVVEIVMTRWELLHNCVWLL
jgi:hypothetical protein